MELDHGWSPADGVAKDVHGLITTYQHVATGDTAKRLRPLVEGAFVILDEVHHAGDERAWGTSVRTALEPAAKRLALSGTPFRSDANPIPFVRYAETGEGTEAQPDFTYGYADALRDGGVVRPVYFPRFDGLMEWTSPDGLVQRADFHDELDRTGVAQRLRAALSLDGEWLPSVLTQAHQRLTAIRAQQPDAGGLVIAADQDHARGIANVIRRRFGQHAEVVVSDDPEASRKIAAFAAASTPWLVAVRMVSEGVDIPRLRVGVYATTVATELFFRQAVGRFVRWQSGRVSQKAYVFIPDDPRLRVHAFRIADARRHVLRPPAAIDDDPVADLERDLAEAAAAEAAPAEQLSLFSVLSAVATGVSVHAFTEDGPDAARRRRSRCRVRRRAGRARTHRRRRRRRDRAGRRTDRARLRRHRPGERRRAQGAAARTQRRPDPRPGRSHRRDVRADQRRAEQGHRHHHRRCRDERAARTPGQTRRSLAARGPPLASDATGSLRRMPMAGEHHPAFEEYCECIFELAEDDVAVIQARIADRLQVSRPAVSEMVRRLDTEGLVTTEGSAIRLTPAGQKLAQQVVRRHRLAERFITDILGLSWALAHHEAGKWEHVMSEEVEQALDRVLGNPTTCPHGNPIPGSQYTEPTTITLSHVAVGAEFTVSRIPRGAGVHPRAARLPRGLEHPAGQDRLDHRGLAGRHRHRAHRRASRRRRGVRQRPDPGPRVKRAACRAAQRGMLGAVIAVGALGLSACVDTQYDSSIPSEPTIAVTTTLPSGPAADLLPRLVAEAGTLSAAITSKGDKSAIAESAQDLWAAAQQQVAAERPELLGGFESNVADLADAARFNRAADADKAFKNLQALTDSFLASTTSAG